MACAGLATPGPARTGVPALSRAYTAPRYCTGWSVRPVGLEVALDRAYTSVCAQPCTRDSLCFHMAYVWTSRVHAWVKGHGVWAGDPMGSGRAGPGGCPGSRQTSGDRGDELRVSRPQSTGGYRSPWPEWRPRGWSHREPPLAMHMPVGCPGHAPCWWGRGPAVGTPGCPPG